MLFKQEINAKEYLNFLAPSILVMAFMSTYIIIDGYFISTFVGSDALAAVNLIVPVNSIIFAFGLMFASGGGAMASIKLGENDKKTASKYFSNLLVVAIGFGIIAFGVSFLFKEQILQVLGVNKELWKYADTYSFYTFMTFPFLISKVIFAGFLRAQGNPKVSLIMTVIGGVANMILDFLFIVILDMGVAGAGLGTMLGITIALIYAAISVILYMHLLVGNSFQGFDIGTAPLISYYYGAKNSYSLQKVLKYAFNSLLIISPIIAILVFLGKSFLVSIFFEPSNPAFELAVQGLSIFTFGFLLIGYNMFGSAMFTALSNGKISAMISFTKTFVIFSIIAYLLPNLMGVKGIWWIMPIVELSIVFLVFYLTRERKLKKYFV